MSISTEELRIFRSKVMAGMETGNTDYARTVLTEMAAVYPEAAQHISLDVIIAYGIVLL